MLPAVHTVGRAGENKFVLAAADADRRQIGVVLVGEIQLKVERAEVGAAQLLRRVEHDAPRCLRQTSEEIDEPGALFPKILQLRAHIFADVFVRQRGDGLVVRFGKAARIVDTDGREKLVDRDKLLVRYVLCRKTATFHLKDHARFHDLGQGYLPRFHK